MHANPFIVPKGVNIITLTTVSVNCPFVQKLDRQFEILYNSIDFKSKIMAISLIVITFSFTVFYAFSFKIDVLFIMFAVLLSIFIITRPSPPQKN